MECRPEEVGLLSSVAKTSFRQAFEKYNNSYDMDEYIQKSFDHRKLLSEINNDGVHYFLVRVANDTIAGYCKLNEVPFQTDINDPKSMELERIYVLNKYHRKGIGKAMMDYILSIVIGKFKTLWLGVWDKNEAAILFYRSYGFEVTGTHDFMLGSDLQTDLLMELTLERS